MESVQADNLYYTILRERVGIHGAYTWYVYRICQRAIDCSCTHSMQGDLASEKNRKHFSMIASDFVFVWRDVVLIDYFCEFC